MTRNEHIKARQWRETLGLSVDELALRTGYSPLAIYWFERGEVPHGRNAKSGNANDRSIKPHVWLRYKMACAGVERDKFNW